MKSRDSSAAARPPGAAPASGNSPIIGRRMARLEIAAAIIDSRRRRLPFDLLRLRNLIPRPSHADLAGEDAVVLRPEFRPGFFRLPLILLLSLRIFFHGRAAQLGREEAFLRLAAPAVAIVVDLGVLRGQVLVG